MDAPSINLAALDEATDALVALGEGYRIEWTLVGPEEAARVAVTAYLVAEREAVA